MSYEYLTVRRDGHVLIIGLDLVAGVQTLFATEDAAIGVQAFLARGTAEFVGR